MTAAFFCLFRSDVMHLLIILLVAVWMIGNVFAILLLKRMPKPAAMVFGAFVALISLGSFAFGIYVFGEFVVNKGPDDWGSLWHAGYPLAKQYGARQECSYVGGAFDKDPDGSGSGTYHVHFDYNDHTGVVLCHYDKASGKFDHDEIVPDK